MRPDFQPPLLLQPHTRRTRPRAGFAWFLLGSVVTLGVLAAVGLLP
jgi:hypothetical protein